MRAEIARLLGGQEYPGIRSILRDLAAFCAARQFKCPSRATVYKLMGSTASPAYSAAELPQAARAALYNLADDARVPGAQLAFYCFNYGDLAAAQYAAGLPWLHLYQAARMRGWRPRCRGLIRAALAVRGLGSA